MQDAKKISLEALAMKNVIDRLSQYFVFIFSAMFALYPFLIAAGLPAISELALSDDLKFPKYGKRILLAMVFLLANQISGRPNTERITVILLLRCFLVLPACGNRIARKIFNDRNNPVPWFLKPLELAHRLPQLPHLARIHNLG